MYATPGPNPRRTPPADIYSSGRRARAGRSHTHDRRSARVRPRQAGLLLTRARLGSDRRSPTPTRSGTSRSWARARRKVRCGSPAACLTATSGATPTRRAPPVVRDHLLRGQLWLGITALPQHPPPQHPPPQHPLPLSTALPLSLGLSLSPSSSLTLTLTLTLTLSLGLTLTTEHCPPTPTRRGSPPSPTTTPRTRASVRTSCLGPRGRATTLRTPMLRPSTSLRPSTRSPSTAHATARCDHRTDRGTLCGAGFCRRSLPSLPSIRTHHSLLTAHHSLLTTHCSLLTAHCSPLTAHHSLLTTH